MPRYFFEFGDVPQGVPDDNGLEFPSLNDAVESAARAAGAMIAELTSGPAEVSILVREGDIPKIRITVTSKMEPMGDKIRAD